MVAGPLNQLRLKLGFVQVDLGSYDRKGVVIMLLIVEAMCRKSRACLCTSDVLGPRQPLRKLRVELGPLSPFGLAPADKSVYRQHEG